MKQQLLLLTTLLGAWSAFAQSGIGHNNAGGLSVNNYAHAVGEIYVVPQNPNNLSSGLLGAVTKVTFTSLGTDTYAEMQGVKYYPNPVESNLTVELPEQAVLANAVLYDIKGSRVSLPPANGNVLNLSGLSAGTYFLTFAETNIKPIKIVKK
nr:T9SS type A sorting domain-containing protein [uncultured Flavobacterium sp.]